MLHVATRAVGFMLLVCDLSYVFYLACTCVLNTTFMLNTELSFGNVGRFPHSAGLAYRVTLQFEPNGQSYLCCLADRQPSKKIQPALIQPRYISVRTKQPAIYVFHLLDVGDCNCLILTFCRQILIKT